jgi:ubiquinone/menaquinone biosynthesis C-methylase UbiE
MKKNSAEAYRCPHSQQELTLRMDRVEGDDVVEGCLTARDGQTYGIKRGIPNLTFPEQLGASDAEFRDKYDRGAEQYDAGLDWLFRSFYEDEEKVRTGMIDLLGLKPGMRVLEIGCGTGKDSVIIARSLSDVGQIFLLEMSRNMLEVCRAKLTDCRGVQIEFLLGNASYLPFPNEYFDAVFHFGGLNTFSEKKRALDEMTRVARIGAKVVVGDESVPPWLREKPIGKILINANPLYKHQLPLEDLPECARNVQVRWILGNAFYLISYQVGDGAPRVDLDLPIPGKGDSLRSRYYRKPTSSS